MNQLAEGTSPSASLLWGQAQVCSGMYYRETGCPTLRTSRSVGQPIVVVTRKRQSKVGPARPATPALNSPAVEKSTRTPRKCHRQVVDSMRWCLVSSLPLPSPNHGGRGYLNEAVPQAFGPRSVAGAAGHGMFPSRIANQSQSARSASGPIPRERECRRQRTCRCATSCPKRNRTGRGRSSFSRHSESAGRHLAHGAAEETRIGR